MIVPLAQDIFVIENFLTAHECAVYIRESESLGYQAADVDLGSERKILTSIRTNHRVDYYSEEIATAFWKKLNQHDLSLVGLSYAVGFTPWFRFYRYEGQQKFNMHKDGSKKYKGHCSQFTFLIYLNDLPDVGATTFREGRLSVFPEVGKGLLFRHNLWHAGMPVGTGTKYVMRTDLLFDQ